MNVTDCLVSILTEHNESCAEQPKIFVIIPMPVSDNFLRLIIMYLHEYL